MINMNSLILKYFQKSDSYFIIRSVYSIRGTKLSRLFHVLSHKKKKSGACKVHKSHANFTNLTDLTAVTSDKDLNVSGTGNAKAFSFVCDVSIKMTVNVAEK